MLVDRKVDPQVPSDANASRVKLQLYVHAKHGNVRYDAVNITEYNDFEPNLAWHSTTRSEQDVYALDALLRGPRANLTVEVLEGSVAYRWSGRLLLNLTADPPLLTVEAFEPLGERAPLSNVTLPFEALLAREVP